MTKPTAIILAAGEGKRFTPLTLSKPLLPFLGRPLIDFIVEDLKKAGITQAVVVVSPRNQTAVKKVLGGQVETAIQEKATGMADAVLAAAAKIKSGPAIVVNADDLVDPQIISRFTAAVSSKPQAPVLTGLKGAKLSGGFFKLKGDAVTGLVEKPRPGDEPSDYFKLVLDYFPDIADLVNVLKNTTSAKDNLYETALGKLVEKQPANLVEAAGYFVQLKHPHQILDAVAAFLTYRLDQKSAIEPSAKIMEGAVVKGSYIGENVVVGNHCLVRDSIVEAGSVVGYSTEIARSYVGPESFFHSSYVGDSVIEGGVNLGSGSRLANFRFDGKAVKLKTSTGDIDTGKSKLGAVLAQGVKLGVNASVMPGVTLGQNAVVGSGVVLTRPIPAGTTLYLKQDLVNS